MEKRQNHTYRSSKPVNFIIQPDSHVENSKIAPDKSRLFGLRWPDVACRECEEWFKWVTRYFRDVIFKKMDTKLVGKEEGCCLFQDTPCRWKVLSPSRSLVWSIARCMFPCTQTSQWQPKTSSTDNTRLSTGLLLYSKAAPGHLPWISAKKERLYLPGMSARGEYLLPQKPS